MLAIIAAIENDSEREFITRIYLKYYKKMLDKAFFIVHNEAEAEEIVQEAFVKLIEHVQDLMRMDSIKVPVYVMVTVKNIAINHWNDAKKENERQTFVADDELDLWLADEKALPEDVYIHTEELEKLAETLPLLPKKDRMVLEFKYILELSDEEIAKELHIKAHSVRSYLTRARRKAYAMINGEDVNA